MDRPLELIAALAAWHPLHRAEVSVVLARASASLWSGFGLRTVLDACGTQPIDRSAARLDPTSAPAGVGR